MGGRPGRPSNLTSLANEARRLAREPLLYLGGSGIQRGLPFLLLPVYTRLLSPEGFGLLSLALVGASISGIVIGLNGHAYIVTRYFAMSAEEVQKALAFMLQFVAITLCLLLGASGAWFLFFPSDQLGAPVFATMLFLGASRSVLASFLAVRQVQFRAGAFFGYSVLTGVLGAAAILALLRVSDGDWRAALLGEAAVTLGVAFVIVARTDMGVPRWLALDGRTARRFLRFSLPLVPHALALWVISFIDRVMLAEMIGPSAVGYYSAVYTTGLALSLVYEALQRAWQPRFFLLLNTGEEGQAGARRLAAKMLAATLLLGVVYIVTAVPLFPVIVGQEYASVALWLIPIGIGLTCHGFHRVFASYLYHRNETAVVALITVGGALVNVAANLVLIPRYGGMGAALATLIAYALLAMAAGGRVALVRSS